MKSPKLRLLSLVSATALASAWVWTAPATASGIDYRVTPVTNGGTIVGMVKVNPIPDLAPATAVSADQDICGNEAPDPSAVIGPDGRLGNAFAYLERVSAGKPFPQGPARLVNHKCLYRPYVQGAPMGGQLEIVNQDDALHNVHMHLGPRTLWNVALPLQGFSIVKTLPSRPGVVQVSCDVHEWMRGAIHLLQNPYFAATTKDGTFRIEEVPAGAYTLVVWHERFGTRKIPVQVAAGQESPVEVTLDSGR